MGLSIEGMTMSDKLFIFDTTLRDGEQSPGASMTKEEKVRVAKSLERMGVDIIEAGFPIASPGDFEAVQAVANVITDSTVCGLARAVDRDIDRAAVMPVPLGVLRSERLRQRPHDAGFNLFRRHAGCFQDDFHLRRSDFREGVDG